MGFNDQVRNMAYGSESKKFIFQENVRFKRMGGKNPVVFRILPAFDPNNNNPCTSWLPFCLPDGNLTDWGRVVYISRYVGHGQNRKDILSLKSFGGDVADPLDMLIQTVNALPEWSYLTKDVGEGKSAIRKALPRPSASFLANVWDINQASQEVVIGVFPTSAAKAFMDSKSGLIYQRANLPAEVLAQNYLLQYSVGDLTSPFDGPAMCIQKGNDKGEMSSFQVFLATDSANRVVKRSLNQEQLGQRYDMNNPASFIEIPTEEDVIKQLISTFNMRSPSGYHEYALLKQAFPTYPIPEAPSAPAASPMIASGFGVNPAAQRQMPPTNTPIPQNMGTAAGAPVPMNMVPQIPTSGFAPSTLGTALTPPPAVNNIPSGIPQGVTSGPSPVPEAAKAAANMAAAQIPQGPAPVVPGDAIPSASGTGGVAFDRNAFLAKLNANKQ